MISNNKKSVLAAIVSIAAIFFAFKGYQDFIRETRNDFSLIFTGQTQGTLKSCGCGLLDFGGLARRANYLSTQSETSLVLDSGNYFAEPQNPDAGRKKAKLYAELAHGIPYDAINIVQDDLRNLESNLKDYPGVSLIHQSPALAPWRTFEKNGLKFWITGIDKSLKFPTEDLGRAILNVPRDVVVIVLSNYPMGESLSFLRTFVERPVLIVGQDLMDPEVFSKAVGASLLIKGGDRGRYIYKSAFTAIFKGKKLAAISIKETDSIPVNRSQDSGAAGEVINAKIKAWEKINGEVEKQH